MSEAKAQKMKMLPAPPGTCAMCARDHDERYPHDATTLFYQMRFQLRHGRAPTWADAAAHCTAETRKAWKQAMREQGVEWTVPDGEPIAEKYAIVEKN